VAANRRLVARPDDGRRAITYFSIVKELAHVAGVYDVNDWMMIDERAERFRPLFNDEYSRDALVGLCVGTHTSNRLSEYTMMQHSNGRSGCFR